LRQFFLRFDVDDLDLAAGVPVLLQDLIDGVQSSARKRRSRRSTRNRSSC
jgi:hypothetical protein